MDSKGKKEQTIKESEAPPKVIMPYEVDKQVKVICDMCGHANPEFTAICEKCSNYIKRR